MAFVVPDGGMSTTQKVILAMNIMGMEASVLLAIWLSKVVLKTSDREQLSATRTLERLSIKLVNARSHLLYSKTRSNVFIYIYIYL